MPLRSMREALWEGGWEEFALRFIDTLDVPQGAVVALALGAQAIIDVD